MRHQSPKRRRGPGRFIVGALVVVVVAAIGVGVYLRSNSADASGPLPVQLPAAAGAYLGVYTHGVPDSYSGVAAFNSTIKAKPDVVMYYSGWWVPFPTKFATTVANNGAVPLVQMDPQNISLSRIASSRYDGYLSAYAEAVRAYHHPVIISFGHEMNGGWYSWGHGRTSPAVFVRAWRYIVKLFRALGANNVTWLWTVNIINHAHGGSGSIPNPAQWWPGSSYVNWVGIDGYYLKPNWKFAPLFGPTITAVKHLTLDPILVAETGAVPAAGQPAKITDLFSGIHRYGLLGFVWFNSTNSSGQQFGLSSPQAVAAFRKGASTYTRPGG
jgi:mannan endo-1,4-beta-mannosidase